MKTYTIIKSSGETLGSGKTLSEAMQMLPAGSKLVSGNKTETIKKEGLPDEVVEIVQATYRTPMQTTISIVEEKK